MKVVLFGSTGVVGSYCLNQLVGESRVEQIVAPTRKTVKVAHPKIFNPVIDFDKGLHETSWGNADAYIWCLGTTQAAAKTAAQFERIEYGYFMQMLALAKRHHVPKLIVLSSTNADPGSIFFYSQIKGRIEDAALAAQFQSVSIIRASLLDFPDRKPRRWVEYFAIYLFRLLNPILSKTIRSIHPSKVAQVICHELFERSNSFRLITSSEIQDHPS